MPNSLQVGEACIFTYRQTLSQPALALPFFLLFYSPSDACTRIATRVDQRYATSVFNVLALLFLLAHEPAGTML